MFCKSCGNKLKEDATFCDKCGQKVDNTESKPVDVNIVDKTKAPYSTWKLVIGIISMVLFVFICIQSCAAGLGNAISQNGESSGSAGVLCALLMLSGGIVSVVTRNSKGKGGAIAATILYVVAALFTIGTGSSFGDLPIWGSIAFIFGMINLASILAKNSFFSQKKNKKFLTIGLIVIAIIAFGVGISSGSDKEVETDTKVTNTTKKETKKSSNKKAKKTNFGLNETFEFDNLEITLVSDITFTKVKNRFSEYNGQDVVRVPVTVKNLKDETHSLNMFYYKTFGSEGTELSNISAYFNDDVVDYAGELKPGASYTKAFYLLYDGDGKYSIDFNNFSSKVSVEFNVTK